MTKKEIKINDRSQKAHGSELAWQYRTREKPCLLTLIFLKLEFDWIFVWADQPDKILVSVEQQYTLSLTAVESPVDRIAAVAFDLAVFDLATSLPVQVTTLSI